MLILFAASCILGILMMMMMMMMVMLVMMMMMMMMTTIEMNMPIVSLKGHDVSGYVNGGASGRISDKVDRPRCHKDDNGDLR